MQNTSYRQALEDARKNLDRLLRDRDDLDAEISKLESAIDSLSALCDESAVEVGRDAESTAVSLRDAIRLIFNMARPNALTPTEVRDKLRQSGFDLDRYKYELPPIHNTIARLEAAGEIEAALRSDGEKAYKFVGVFARAARRAREEKEKNLQVWSKL